MSTQNTRKSHLDPVWFSLPNNEDFTQYIENKVKTFTKRNIINKISAIVVPHAGYAYSLDTALEAYSLLKKGEYDRAIILCPSHRAALFEQVAIEPAGIVETAQGNVTFDEDLNNKLKTLDFVIEDIEISQSEHSIHIQLPLIRHFLGDIPLTAMMFGQWKYGKSLENAALALYNLLSTFEKGIERTLFIISSDFTHYGEMFHYIPFTSDIKENLHYLDHTVYHCLASQDIKLFEKVLHKTKATVCGAVPFKFFMALLPEKAKFEEIAYATSGEITGDFKNSVSYLSAIILADYTTWAKNFYVRLPNDKLSYYTAEERQMMLDIAKKSFYYSVEHNEMPRVDYDTIPPKLMEERAVFVTLEKQGNLRGCIGDILPSRPLVDSIIARAYSAALEDTRFTPVKKEEIPFIDVELSILSLPILTKNYKDIVLGTHGIILKKEQYSAVFLPQVATEQGWTLEETLSQLSEKAGLDTNAWKEGCDFYLFTTEILKD